MKGRFESVLALALLAGCAGPQTAVQPPTVLRQAQDDRVSLHDDRASLHAGVGQSWMQPTKKASVLLYVAVGTNGDVNVYDYASGKLVGTLTGLGSPNNGCVDKKGDVFITNFGNGETYEYAHGGSKRLNTYTTNGYVVGCSLDAQGDLAVTDYYSGNGAGQVCIWKGGTGSSTCYSDGSACYFMWPAGYDDKGNIYVEGEYSSIVVCELPKGGSTMQQVQYTGGTIDFPGAVMWDGKYLTLSDQESGGTFTDGIYQATESSSGDLAIVGKTQLTDTCYSDYTDVVAPFIVGKKNTPVNRQQGTQVVGSNIWCYDAGKPDVDIWSYPAGGNPVKSFNLLNQGTVLAVSIGK